MTPTGPDAAGSASGVFVARPRQVIRHVIAWTVVLTAGALLGWFALPAHIRALFTPFQIGTLLFFLAVMLFILWAVALSYVRADASGVTLRNGLRTHRLGWERIAGVRYTEHDAFGFLELYGDVDRMLVMGIQRTDGPRAQRLADELRTLYERYRTR